MIKNIPWSRSSYQPAPKRWYTAMLRLVFLSFVFLSCHGHDKKVSEKANSETEKPPQPKPLIIEVVGNAGTVLNANLLSDFYKDNYRGTLSVYQWKNHLVVYGNYIGKPEILLKEIEVKYPGDKVNVYSDPFYEFNRKRCADPVVAKEWDNILLTANLVNDPKLQKEYLDYHATQFEKWPEVSKGFCNAEFQQLLVFRNGRQLMLVISIPAHKSLDSLNPKTTENNPRVDEWNKIMKKYQEGIEGTKAGEVWVFLEKVHVNRN